MFETGDFASIPAINEDTRTLSEPLREPSPEFDIECGNSLPEFGNEPRSASELAKHFGVTDRAVQNWHPIIKAAYRWLPETDLKTGTGKNTRYTPLAIKAMAELKAARASGQTADDWIEAVHTANADKLQPPQPEQPIQPEVIDQPESSGLAVYTPPVENTDSIIAGLAIPTKATEKREILKGELVLQEQSNDESWEEFTALMSELQEETEAAQEDDELEFQLLRKQHAAKWLKRKAVLEQDKLRILQGQVAPKNGQTPNGSSASA